jgi:ATP-dependent HslUV protease ATP-binding subunit HslU
MSTENLGLTFTKEALEEIARLAEHLNATAENIGARRLYTIMEKVLEEISFDASDMQNEKVEINKNYVLDKVEDIAQDTDLSKYIL